MNLSSQELHWIVSRLHDGRSVKHESGTIIKPHTSRSTGHEGFQVIDKRGAKYFFSTAKEAALFAVNAIHS